MINTTIAHYRVTEKIGEGGMGEVYRATDTKLHRDVALKILPEQFAADRDRMGRFHREAELLASLDHPNIGAIYGIEKAGDSRALVLQLIEGPTLADRLEKGRLPLEEALPVALQIAEALECAHDHGVIHRDLKPANIKFAADGKVKVLDFGLAKALEGEPDSSSPDMTHSPTLSVAATQAGLILGTASYMAPEQARGRPADRRSDIWAFGVVLYEMLSGAKAFDGEDLSMVMAAVMMKEPDLGDMPPEVPGPVRNLIERCLRKDPNQRLQSIGDARIALQEYLADPDAVAETVATTPTSSGWKTLPVAVAALVAAVAGAGIMWFLTPAPQTPLPIKVSVEVSGKEPLQNDQGASSVLSPDGRLLAYVTGTTDALTGRLYVRSLDLLEGEFLAGTEAAYNPFFSPDGRWIGFVTPTQLSKVAVAGGSPLALCSVNLSRGADWGSSGQIVFAPGPAGGLRIVSEAGGEPRDLTTLEEGETSHRWPHFLPDGRHVLFSVYGAEDRNRGRIEAVEIETGDRTVVHEGGTYARYAESGHLLYLNSGTIFAAPLDLSSLQLTALPTPVLQEVNNNAEGGAQYDVSSNGTLAYITGSTEGVKRKLSVADSKGQFNELSDVDLDYRSPRLSPDGRRMALEIVDSGNPDIWVLDLERGTRTRLTFGVALDRSPIWSKDGSEIFFGSNRGGKFGLYRMPSDGSGEAQLLLEGVDQKYPYSISPDGTLLAFHELHRDSNYDLWTVPLDGSEEARRFFDSNAGEADPTISPNGRWLAYDADESGRWEIYVRAFPGPGGKWQISVGGGEYPRWTPDGRRLFYKAGNAFWSVDIDDSDGFRASRPRQIVELEGSIDAEWDLARDGQGLIVVRTPQVGTGLTHIKFTFNWFEELKAIRPAGR